MSLIRPRLSAEVAAAQQAGTAIVALESTIITHGMPYPDNFNTAVEVEDLVRANGATPATIAVVDGVPRVGLEREELRALAKAEGVVKASGRDLAVAMVRKASAGTTVSATMVLAKLCRIDVFATGGVGGVHRGAEETFDVSADLTELGRTKTTVVCAGVKSILDIAKTLEFLETQRVPVIAYRTDEFPAFFALDSGHKADHRLDTADDVAAAMWAHHGLGTGTGLLIANPIPPDAALSGEFIDGIIESALRDAEVQGISRKQLTPFLLERINELSNGDSLKANIALVKNNAVVAAQIAVAYAALISGNQLP